MKNNIIPHAYKISKFDRQAINKHNSFLIWFTGLSGSGKSTIANLLEQEMYKHEFKTYVLDGDNIRKGLNKDLSFRPEDRSENMRRIAEVSKLMIDAGIIVIAAFVSPYEKDRLKIKHIVKPENFIEIYINTSIEECERRDVKGLYKKAREGEIKNMTGISSPYEPPKNPDLEILTENISPKEAVNHIINFIKPKLQL